MKNIHVLPTDKPSRLGYIFDNLILNSKLLSPTLYKNQNIYITDNSEIKEGDWFYNTFNDNQPKLQKRKGDWRTCFNQHKIILTTDQDLIKDGIQEISEDFLEWFVKNPSCEFVEVSYGLLKPFKSTEKGYMIHLPDTVSLEEPRQYPSIPLDCTHDIVIKYGVAECQNCGLEESKISKQLTIKKAAKSYRSSTANKMAIEEVAFQEGAKSDAARDYWYKKFQEQNKNKFSDEEVLEFANWCRIQDNKHPNRVITTQQLFEQFKKQNNEQ